jgi:hypothetical protein
MRSEREDLEPIHMSRFKEIIAHVPNSGAFRERYKFENVIKTTSVCPFAAPFQQWEMTDTTRAPGCHRPFRGYNGQPSPWEVRGSFDTCSRTELPK